MTIINNIVSKEEFTKYLVEGIDIPAHSSTELYDFAERLIRFINLADNTYWAALHMSKPDTIIVDHKNIEIANIELAAGKLTFLMPANGAAQERPKDYGHIAEGVVLFFKEPQSQNNESRYARRDSMPGHVGVSRGLYAHKKQ